jgi:hypothetical protein
MNYKHSFTKGPWTAEYATKDDLAIVTSQIPPYKTVCTIECNSPVGEQNHTAALIAAAPELLELLMSVGNQLTSDDEHPTLLASINAAIKKAKGEN